MKKEKASKNKIKWKNEIMGIKDLIPADYNPRILSDFEKEQLSISIDKYNQVDPIAVNTDRTVIGGHQRLKVMADLGFREVEVRIPDRKLNKKEEKELNLRLNRNKGAFDYEKLLKMYDFDFLSEAGFTEEELNQYLDFEVEEDEFKAEEEYQNIKEPTANKGEIYQMGKHRLMCGDSAKREDVEKLMNKQLGRMIFTDPPYNVNYKSPGGLDYSSTKFGGTGGQIFNDNKSDKECVIFYMDVLKNLYDFSTDDVTIYWWFANINVHLNRFAFESAGWKYSQTIIWLKNSFVFSRGQDYHRIYEPCMLGWKKGKSHYKDKKINNLKDANNLDYDSFVEMMNAWYEQRDLTRDYVHPTQKPLRLPERALKKNSQTGDIVIDLFGGSGSTLLACEQMERICYAMELDPKYVDVIISRWEKYTGDKAKKVS